MLSSLLTKDMFTIDNIRFLLYRGLSVIKQYTGNIMPQFYLPNSHTILFGLITFLVFIILFALICVVIVRSIYKIGFYGKQYFNTKYDVFSYFSEDSIICNDELPLWNKYCDVNDITVVNGDNITDKLLDEINELLQVNRRSINNRNSRMFLREIVMTREPSYVVIHRKTTADCVLIATPANLKIIKGKKILLPIYNIEYYPVDCCYSSSFQTSFATLHYFQQSNTPQAKISLLKTKSILWNITPLCIITENTYKIDKKLDYKFDVAKKLRFFVAKKDNIRTVIDFIEKKTNNDDGFDIVITKEITDILGLISSKQMVIIGCMILNKVVGVLIFKDVSIFSHYFDDRNDTSNTVELSSSLFDNNLSGNIKQACFSRGVILANRIIKASYLKISIISHNQSIINMLNGLSPISKTQCGYYLRNYRTMTRLPERCLIVV